MPTTRKDPAPAAVTAAVETSDVTETPSNEAATPAATATATAATTEATTPRRKPRAARPARSGGERAATPSAPLEDAVAAGGPSITETEPGHIQMVQASAADIRATMVEAHQSAAARVQAESVSLSQGASGFVRGGEVHIEQAAVGALAADHVEFREGFALLVLARRVSGRVVVLFDWRGLVAAAALLLVLGRLLRGRG